MLSRGNFLLHKNSYFAVYFRWVFTYFRFIFLFTFHRLFTPSMNKIKEFCFKYTLNSRFYTTKISQTVFKLNLFSFLSTNGFMIFTKELKAAEVFFSTASTFFINFSLIAVIQDKYFYNFYNNTLLDMVNILYKAVISTKLYAFFYYYYFSNFILPITAKLGNNDEQTFLTLI